MKWGQQALIWPNRAASRFVDCRPHRWHVQEMGPEDAPAILLLHGAGGATHSWRDLMPALARQFRVVALDLPGQGFTRLGSKHRSGLDPTATDIASLATQEGWRFAALIGHSAGAALALRLAQKLEPVPVAVIGLNAALESFPGPAEWAFPVIAKMLSLNPMVPTVFAASAGTSAAVRSLIQSTGSTLDGEGIALYRAAISDAEHVEGALNMMAQWDLEGLQAALPGIDIPTLLIVGDGDRAVPPETSERAAKTLPNATVQHLPDLGHLAHEEAPDLVATRIAEFLDTPVNAAPDRAETPERSPDAT